MAVKAASGAAETTPYVMVTNLARTLVEERDIAVIGTAGEANSDPLRRRWPAASAWVMGAEGEGLRRLTRGNLRYAGAHSDVRCGRES